MSEFKDIKELHNEVAGHLCYRGNKVIREVLAYLESQIEAGRLGKEYKGIAGSEWTSNEEANPEEGGEYLIKGANGKEHEAIWDSDDDEFYLKGHEEFAIRDEDITYWKKKPKEEKGNDKV